MVADLPCAEFEQGSGMHGRIGTSAATMSSRRVRVALGLWIFVGGSALGGCDAPWRDEPGGDAAGDGQAKGPETPLEHESKAGASGKATVVEKMAFEATPSKVAVAATVDAKAEAEAEARAKAEAGAKAETDAKAEADTTDAAFARAEVQGAVADARTAPWLAGGAADPPVVVRSLRLEPDRLVTGAQYGAVRLAAQVEVVGRPGSRRVMVAAQCRLGRDVVSDTAELSSDDERDLEEFRRGDTAQQSSMLFMQGISRVPAPCQLSLSLQRSEGGGRVVELGRACWHDAEITPGDCVPAVVVPVPTMAAAKFGRVATSTTPFGSVGLDITQRITFAQTPPKGSTMKLKATCDVDGKRLVDTDVTYYGGGPDRPRPGETQGRDMTLFSQDTFDLSVAPTSCDLTTTLWKPIARSDRLEEVLVDRSCLHDTTVSAGPCDPSRAWVPAGSAEMTATTTQIDAVTFASQAGLPGRRNINLIMHADVTVSERLRQIDHLHARATCTRAGKTVRRTEALRAMWLESHELAPGETMRVRSRFGDLDPRPDHCEIEFIAGRNAKAGTVIATHCLVGATVTVGACPKP